MKTFLEVNNVFVVKGYLSSNKDKVQPISNSKFIAAQKIAEQVITFVDKAKGKDFVGKKADSITDINAEVRDSLAKKGVEYVKTPKLVKGELTEKLKNEALAWMGSQKNVSKVEKVNDFMQKFNIVYKLEDIGLFFDEEIVEINKIYTIKEITKAATEIVDILDLINLNN